MVFERRNRISSTGERGEKLVSRILPKAKHVDGMGYDFLLPNQKRLEVKAHYGESGQITFKIKSKYPWKAGTGVWHNAAAHHLLIVTKTHLLLVDASEFREFIKRQQHTVLDPAKVQTVSYQLEDISAQPWVVKYPRKNLKDREGSAKFLNDYFGTEVA
ncbi:MAG: hypothetical protein QXR53_03075 [Candidatus Norongarragalinales archaeon]